MKKRRSRISGSTQTKYEESESDDESLSSSSSLSDNEEEEEIEKELAHVTFQELQKARSNGEHVFFNKPRGGENEKLKRANKNRPMEASSKKLVPAFRDVIQTSKKVVRDPRFESLCGTFDLDGRIVYTRSIFEYMIGDNGGSRGEIDNSESSLDFHFPLKQLKEDWKRGQVAAEAESTTDVPLPRVTRHYGRLRRTARSTLAARGITVKRLAPLALKKKLRKYKDPERRSEIEERLAWVDKQLKSGTSKNNIETQILAKHKKKEREAAKQGKRPFYLKKSEIRNQGFIEKYDNLKSSGKLDSFLEKKRKRNAAKDRKFMPYARSVDNVE
ncbi:hypothetical protein TSUD_264950 [Trifolium subterraneum]|uniref:rRNA biogenesis protein RRP36 n=1 Tax=Trifolium subterraneum TaxID=3900 RepID=A0A2Z6NEX6_TRISU|nr:hypothetical protein TSUD_264950 [Trifolium subterraneum]